MRRSHSFTTDDDIDSDDDSSPIPGESDADEDVQEPINRSVTRAMSLLKELGNHRGGATAKELAARVGLNRATSFRLLQSLVQAGIITKSGSTFMLGWEVTRLGRLADPYQALLPRIQVILEGLATRLNEYVGFSVVLDPITLEIIAESDGSHAFAPKRSYMGMKFPLHASGNGKILLAELSDDHVRQLLPARLEQFAPQTITDPTELLAELAEVRSRGYATIDNESEEGLLAVSVAVKDPDDGIVGVLTAAGLDRRMKRAGEEAIAQVLQAAAPDLSRVFGAPTL